MAKKRKNFCVLLIVLLAWHHVDAQTFWFTSVNQSVYCNPTLLFSDMYNARIVHLRKGLSLSKIRFSADSVLIKRVNDSLFLFKPAYGESVYKLVLESATTSQRIDSVTFESVSQPFYFKIANDGVTDAQYIVNGLYKINLLVANRSCFDYSKKYSLCSYDLVLDRNGEAVFRRSYVGDAIISSECKKQILSLYKEGDILRLENIVLVSIEYRDAIFIKSYGLLKMKSY